MSENHRTVDRVTRILEEVVYNPGMTLAELTRALDAPKSSVHGFVHGLLAKGWLYEANRGFYLGPALYGLTLVSGYLHAGLVSRADLEALNKKSGLAVFLGVPANEYLIYVATVGDDPVAGYDARSNIRRTLPAPPAVRHCWPLGATMSARLSSAAAAPPTSQLCSGLPRRVRGHQADTYRHECPPGRKAVRNRHHGAGSRW